MTTKVRFAPSPTGFLHIGNARTALLNWLFASGHGGRFVLRFDDTDVERSKREYADATEADLAWLGIVPDETVRQSERFALYAAAAQTLKAQGRLYPCYEAPDELDRRRKRQLARGLPPVYDRAALKLTAEERAALEAAGRKPHWRFLLDHRLVGWTDLVRGPEQVDCASLSDPVLVREDGSYLYTLPSIVDDIDLGISHVIRGEDHVTNTGVQIQIFEALSGKVPVFGHHNLLTSATGEGLSKRSGALSLKSLREDGLEPMAVASLAVLVGSSDAVRAVPSLRDLGDVFDLAHISKSAAKFDPAELDLLNAKLLHAMPYDEAAPRLKVLSVDGGEAFWNAVRGNLARFDEAATWWQVVQGEITPAVADEDKNFIAAALEDLPPEPWDGTTWSAWTNLLKQKTGRKGRPLFMPLRLALTGRADGPELAALLPLIGRPAAAARLRGSSS